MGKILDALLGRSFKASKFKILVHLAISRLAILKNQRQTRCLLARRDVLELLNLGHHERALVRVEQVVKEQNMLDVFVMIEGYCILLSERVKMMERVKTCPDELKEAVSTLIFAASRCGEFPELQRIRSVFTKCYGKELALRAVELRNNCGVNPKMVQKLSTRLPSLEIRLKALKEIADENGIALQLDEASTVPEKTNLMEEDSQSVKQQSSDAADFRDKIPQEVQYIEGLSSSMCIRKQYKDVTDAAQEAFLSAAYAAAAARAAVQLSRSAPQPPELENDQFSKALVLTSNTDVESELQTHKGSYLSAETIDALQGLHSTDTYSFDSEDEGIKEEYVSPDIKHIKEADLETNSEMSLTVLRKDEQLPAEVVFDEIEHEVESDSSNFNGSESPWGGRGTKLPYFSHRHTSSTLADESTANQKKPISVRSQLRLDVEKKPISVRTRR